MVFEFPLYKVDGVPFYMVYEVPVNMVHRVPLYMVQGVPLKKVLESLFYIVLGVPLYMVHGWFMESTDFNKKSKYGCTITGCALL